MFSTSSVTFQPSQFLEVLMSKSNLILIKIKEIKELGSAKKSSV